MGFIYQVPAVVGGTVLVIERIESQNYDPGVAGWAIEADGDAEFNNVTTRGVGIWGDPNGEHIEAGGTDAPNGFAFYSGLAIESAPGTVEPFVDPSLAGMALSSNTLNGGGPGDGAAQATIQVWRYSAALGGRCAVQITADDITMNMPPASGTFKINRDITRIGEAWTNVTRVNSWVDFAGSRARYYRDSLGIVHVNGVVASGTAALIGTLPVGFRPSQSHEFALPGAAAINVLCAVRINTDGTITVVSNLASAQARLALDFSFPIL